MITETIILIVIAAFICEWIDSALGMGYGTILSPFLIILGFQVSSVVPAILLSQALGSFSASIFHHKNRNAHFHVKSKNPVYIIKKIREHGLIGAFNRGVSEDLKTAAIVTSLGVFAVIIAAFVNLSIPKTALNLYIGFLVLFMGILIMCDLRFTYSTGKMLIVGIVSAFNKGLSGGGFGPVVTGGQMVLGKDHKRAIACTTASEPLICITGFISYLLLKGISSWGLIIALGIGAVIAGPIGPFTTKKINKDTLKIIVAGLMILLGMLALVKTFNLFPIHLNMSI